MRSLFRLLAIGFSFSLSLSSASQAADVPRPGDRFDVRQRIETQGTYSDTGEATGEFTQRVEFDLVLSVLDTGNEQVPIAIDFAYRRVLLEVRMASDSAILELYPDRMILDGTPLYNLETDSDEPPPLLCNLLNETLRMEIGADGKLVEFKQRREYRRNDTFLDLAEPVRSLWIETPLEEPKVGDTWTRSEPVRMLADLIRVPATPTYTVLAVPNDSEPTLVLSRRLFTENADPIAIPPRIGYAVPANLRSDALGPDLFALPPSARFENWIVDSTETIHYRTDWRLPQEKKGNATLSFACSLPRIDGPRRYHRSFNLRRTWTVTIQPTQDPLLDKEALYILIGRENGSTPLESNGRFD